MDQPYDLSRLTPAPVTVYDVINTALTQHYGDGYGETRYMCCAVERLADLGNISWLTATKVTDLIMEELRPYISSYLRHVLEEVGIEPTLENRYAFWWFFLMKHGHKEVHHA